MGPKAQNIKIGPDGLDTVKNHTRAQNMKTGSDALGTTKNDFESAEHESGTRRFLYRQKRVRERKT
jgi:hypothetical protein